jgi:hydrocephalus-inducing protein
MSVPMLNFSERMLEAISTEKIQLINKEHLPFSFNFDLHSFQLEGQQPALSVSPTSGVIGPDSVQDVIVTFKPLEEREFNFNVVCNVKRKKEPLVLNVKGRGYKIHASLTLDEPAGKRTLYPGIADVLDFGMLQMQESRKVGLILKNSSTKNINFQVRMFSGASKRPRQIGNHEQPPYLAISNTQGVAAKKSETPIELIYAPKDAHALDGSQLQIVIPAGPKEEVFTLNLAGGAKRSRVELSFVSHDFGPCFIARGGATMAGEPFAPSENSRFQQMDLIATNRDDSDCLLSTTFQREPWLDVQLETAMIESGSSLRIPIIFQPREVEEYRQRIEFLVNDHTKMHVDIKGRGCPLRLELTDLEMQHVDFGVTTGGKPVSRSVRLVNKSSRPVTFELTENGEELSSRAISWLPSLPTTLAPRQTCDVELRFTPTFRIAPFRLPLTARCSHGIDLRLLQVSGTCHATEMRLSEHSVFFGDVIVGSQSQRTVRLHNFGDLGAKFRFEVPAKFAKVFSISPVEGYARPQEEMSVVVKFHPTADKVENFRRLQKQAAMRRGKTITDDSEVTISCKDIRCVPDGHPPLFLEVSGQCVERVGQSTQMEFNTGVRTRTVRTVEIVNTTDSDWKLHPNITTTEPPGAPYFQCDREVHVPAGGKVNMEVAYLPLMMTEQAQESDEAAAAGASAKFKRLEVHRGRLFIGTPDGQAISYTLEGTADPPKVEQRLEVEVPCKKRVNQAIPVENWLHERQRFDVKVELIEPAGDMAEGIDTKGVSTFDLQPSQKRDYKFNIYAYHECSSLVRVTFTSEATKEYMIYEIAFKFTQPSSLATIEMKTACRQLAHHTIAVTNPLMKEATFTGTCSHSAMRFSPETITVPARSEKTIELLFRPLEEGEDEAQASLKSPELGIYPYTVKWTATTAGMEKPQMLKAPLGGSTLESFKFINYAKQNVTYTATIQPGRAQKGNPADFILDQATVVAPAATDKGSEVSLNIRYQPSGLGECLAKLVITAPGGGEYQASLTGYAQPPQPQGPFTVVGGKPTMIKFRNPFLAATEFAMHVDNVAFTLPSRSQRIDPQKEVDIPVTFKPDGAGQGGRLIISCQQASTPWIFFLKGEI